MENCFAPGRSKEVPTLYTSQSVEGQFQCILITNAIDKYVTFGVTPFLNLMSLIYEETMVLLRHYHITK